MIFFGFNITRAKAAPAIRSLEGLSPEALSWLRGEDTNGHTGTVLSNAYQQVVWVYRAINALAEQVANIPFLFSAGDRGRESLITTGPLADFYAHPHPQINAFQYWELRIIWLMLRGECFRVPVFEGRKLRRVLILDPSRFQHIVQNNQLIGWRYTGLSQNSPMDSQVLLPEEVWFEKLPNPFDFWRGMPPLFAGTLAAQTDFAASSFMHGLIDNNADLGVIVRTDQQLSNAQQEQILADLRNRKRRAGTADRPLLLWSGAEVVKPQVSSADMQFLENRKFTRSEICSAFGVPEEIVTTTDHAKYDVMAGARLNFIENRVAPLCRRLEAEENSTTIPALLAGLPGSATPGSAGIPAGSSTPIQNQKSKIKNPVVGWFDIDSLPIMQTALQARLTAARTGFQMGIPFNELNRVLDLGFKPLPWGDTGYVAGNMQALGPQS